MCKFTIAIPVYNGVKNIAEAVDSGVSQDYESEFQVLVVDNNSNDGTSEVLNNYLDKIEIVKNIRNVSMYENHNICLEKANGDYVLFCHSDDLLQKNALSILHKEISSYEFPDKFVIWGRSMFRDYGKAYQMAGGEINKVLAGVNSIKTFLYGGITPSGTCYSKESFLALGGFINCKHRLAPSDWITMIMLALEGFEFKMIDRLYFQRTFASTLVKRNDSCEALSSLCLAVSELQKMMSKEKFDRLINISLEMDFPPLNFYYGCVQNGISSDRITKILIRKLIRQPMLIRNKIVKRTFRAYFRQ